jgi:hypothetical protein
MEAFNQSDPLPPKSQRQSANAIPTFCVQIPDIHPAKVLFAKDKLPDGNLLPPVAIALGLNTSMPQANNNPVSESTLSVIVYKC